jgi:LacI family transcriptional regulator
MRSDGSGPVVPTVLFSRALEDVPLPQVVNDDLRAGRLAAECLIVRGHHHIVWVGGGQETSTARDRLAGCRAALADAGLPPPCVLHGPTSRRFGHEAVHAVREWPDPPSGMVCFSDLIAFGAITACHDLGLVPGRDLSIVGCDDMEEAGLSFPRLTTVAVDKGSIGRAASHSLLYPPSGGGVTCLPPRLILRETVGPVA